MTKDQLIRSLRPFKDTPKERVTAPPEKPLERSVTRKEDRELPDRYDVTELVLLPVEPYRIFAYWEVASQALSGLMNRLGLRAAGGSYVIRVYDVTAIRFTGNNAHHYFDLPVDLSSRNWYINLWSGEKSLVGDLGYLLADGRFHLLARSNVVQTARSGVSIFTEARWAKPFNRHGRLRFHTEEPLYITVAERPGTGPALWEKFMEESLAFSSSPGQPFSLFRPRTQSGGETWK
jgi:hypothetical protein